MSSGELFVHTDLQSESFIKVEYVKLIQTTGKNNIKIGIHTCILHMHTMHIGRSGRFNAILFRVLRVIACLSVTVPSRHLPKKVHDQKNAAGTLSGTL